MASASPSPEGVTRREWLRNGLLFAGAAAAGAAATGVSAAALEYILGPPVIPSGTIVDALTYVSFPTDQWWNSLGGQPVKVTDFGLWQGATAVWRGLFLSRQWVQGTGYPALVIRVPRVDAYYSLPANPPWTLPPGYSLFYDDPARDIRIVVGLDRCTHLCCYPGWHVLTNPPPDYGNYLVPPPTYTVYGQDPIYCICHGAQYDPLLLIEDTNPHTNSPFAGMEIVHGPGTFGLPLIPLRTADDVLYGGMADSRWYVYC